MSFFNTAISLFVFLFVSSSFALESELSSFQVRPEGSQVIMSVGGASGGPAAELVELMEKAGVKKTLDVDGNPTYSQAPLWAFSSSHGGPIGYSFFSRASVADTSWSLTSLVVADETVKPAIRIQGTELFLDSETSKVLYEILGRSGLPESKTGAISSYRGTWTSCDQRNFNPAKPFWVCAIRNYKW